MTVRDVWNNLLTLPPVILQIVRYVFILGCDFSH